MRRRFTIIFNPAAGWRRRQRLDAVVRRLEKKGASVRIYETSGPGDAREFTRTLDVTACDAVVAAGGDGTINEVANGLSENQRGRPPLGLIPLGTANVLAGEIGLSAKPGGIARALRKGAERDIDCWRVNGRVFVMMAGVGFDAWVVRKVSARLKKRLGKGAYVLWSLIGIFAYPFRSYDVQCNGIQVRAASVIAANGRFYGGRYLIAPDARLDDRKLHLVLLKSTGPIAVLRYGAALVSGRLATLKDVSIIPCEGARIESHGDRAIQTDGDDTGECPAMIEAGPRLTIVMAKAKTKSAVKPAA